MNIQLNYKKNNFTADLNKPIDISIQMGKVKCFYAPDVVMTPYQSGDFIGSVKSGAPVNFFNVQLNPHGNGTHTECLGHITEKQESVNEELKQYHFIAELISVKLKKRKNGDKVISLKNLKKSISKYPPKALIVRTLPNKKEKLTKDYSGTNPPYLGEKAMRYLVRIGIKHLLIDLPSVDREEDEGVLNAHHIFWNLPSKKPRKDCTITELIFIPEKIKDGLFLLNLQLASLQLDAVPSKPCIYELKKSKK